MALTIDCSRPAALPPPSLSVGSCDSTPVRIRSQSCEPSRRSLGEPMSPTSPSSPVLPRQSRLEGFFTGTLRNCVQAIGNQVGDLELKVKSHEEQMRKLEASVAEQIQDLISFDNLLKADYSKGIESVEKDVAEKHAWTKRALCEAVGGKADVGQVEAVGCGVDALAAKVASIDQTIHAMLGTVDPDASTDDGTREAERIRRFREVKRVGELDDAVTHLDERVHLLIAAMREKADINMFEKIDESMSGIQEQLGGLERGLQDRALAAQLEPLSGGIEDMQAQLAKLSKAAADDRGTDSLVKKLNSDVERIHKDLSKFKQTLLEKVGRSHVQQLSDAIGSLRTQVTNNNRAIQAAGLAGQAFAQAGEGAFSPSMELCQSAPQKLPLIGSPVDQGSGSPMVERVGHRRSQGKFGRHPPRNMMREELDIARPGFEATA